MMGAIMKQAADGGFGAAYFYLVSDHLRGRLRRLRSARFLHVLTIAAGLLILFPARPFAEGVELRLEHFMPVASIQHTRFFLPWAQRIEAASKGRIRMNVSAAMGLGGKPPELIAQVEQSKVDIVWALAGYTPQRFPKLSVFELPWLVSSRAAVTSMALYEYAQTYAADELANLHVLALWCHSSGVIMSRDREVLLPSDLKGLKVRIPSSLLSSMVAAFGAEPVTVPAPTVAAEFDQGHIDVTVFPYEVVPTFQLEKRVRHISEFAGDRGLYTSVFILAMNKSSYEKLSPEMRRVIDQNSGLQLAAEMGRLWDEFDDIGRNAFQDANQGSVTFIKGERYEEWYRQTQPVVNSWIQQQKEKGVDGEKLLQAAKDLIKKYSLLWRPL
jgi:TRAP-type C4-dicarboxylate transport system substrate-binding protein